MNDDERRIQVVGVSVVEGERTENCSALPTVYGYSPRDYCLGSYSGSWLDIVPYILSRIHEVYNIYLNPQRNL